MANFGETLFENNRLLRWVLSPVLLLFLFSMPMMVDQWNPAKALLVGGMEAAGLLLLCVFWLPPELRHGASRLLTFLVFLAYGAYMADELFLAGNSGVGEMTALSIMGFFVIGIPCLWYAIFGSFRVKRGIRKGEEKVVMEADQIDTLVRHLEAFSRANPRAYRRNVLLLGLLGYVYIFGILALLVGGLIILFLFTARFHHAYVAIKLGLPLLALGYLILKSLWVHLEPPEGVRVDLRLAPRLIAEIDSIREALGGARVDRILINWEFNAAVMQIPTLGIVGRTRNYLVIGMPLLMALSPKEFRAVMLHEFGHFFGGHGKTGSFVYRIRATWGRIMHIMDEQEHWGAFFFRRFFNWYVPYFNAYSFVMARDQEYEADRISAECTSVKDAASALVASEVRNRHLDTVFWPRVFATVAAEPEPPHPFTQMLIEPLQPDDEKSREWLEAALKRVTGTANTHPELADRLNALGFTPEAAEPLVKSAAAYFLDENLPRLVAEVDARWRAQIEESWKGRHEYIRSERERLAELREMPPAERTIDNEKEIADIVELIDGSDAALPLYREQLDRNDMDAGMQFAVGRILLESGDESGLAHLDRAMELDRSLEMEGCGIVYSHLIATGRDKEARLYLERLKKIAEIHHQAEKERRSITAKDAIQPHRLEVAEVQQISAQLYNYEDIKAAWLAQKTLLHLPEAPLYILAVSVSRPWYRFQSENYCSKFANRLAQEMRFPGETLIMVATQSTNKPVWKRIRNIPESRIFSR